MQLVVALAMLSMTALAADLPPSCSRPVYCQSRLLHCFQLARLFQDSKSFVDLQLVKNENETLDAFDQIYNQTNSCPSREQLQTFLEQYFHNNTELESWSPPDFSENPTILVGIRDELLKKFAKDIIAIWPTLGRKVKAEVFKNEGLTSLVPVRHGFIIPGGRFTELYYWDTYWIIEGLLISGMKDTARGKIENLIELLRKFGHVPNGSRWYYQERSQPPLLSAMVSLYLRETNDLKFLRDNIKYLEYELNYWLENHVVTFDKDDKAYTLLRYYAPSEGPRPESYFEDFTNAQTFASEERQQEFYVDVKSAAESGWDFSSRWFIDSKGENDGNLTNIHTTELVPVDLNAIFANALQNVAYFQAKLKNPVKFAHWGYLAKQWRSTIEQVLWDDKEGIWNDYNIDNGEFRRYFYPSNVAPLWMGVVDKHLVKKHADQVLSYLRRSQGLRYPGGVPASLKRSGEQWDFPNAWPPLVSIVVNALEALGTQQGKEAAFRVAQTWVRANYKGFNASSQMFEKYDVEVPGQYGAGGEYTVQNGFGWTNGVVLELIAKYKGKMTAVDEPGTTYDNDDYSDELLNLNHKVRSTGTRPMMDGVSALTILYVLQAAIAN